MSAVRTAWTHADAEENSPVIKVSLLGGFDASVGGEPVPGRAWRLRKARELVKLLALASAHRLHREQAMDVLWRDRSPVAAANNLHQAVYVARRALSPAAIQLRDEMLELHAEVDIDELKHAAAHARRTGAPSAYRAALALYPGDLLPENRYEDWVEERREELAELAEELEHELAAIAPRPVPSPHVLPAGVSSFIGRRRELRELDALLTQGRLLTLAGAGGVGKTRLALELARVKHCSYPDGAALVELAALTDPDLVADAVASAVDVRASEQSVLDALCDYLTPRSQLIILDNCEHLLGASARLAETLLERAPGLSILATSREPLRIPGEVVFRVPSLAIADPEQPAEASELLAYEGVHLFVERARAAAPGFVLHTGNSADVARICFRLDGLPLALELAAARLGALGPAAIARRLDDRLRVLRSASLSAPSRQRTLMATIEWSHDLLALDEQILFRRLAIFAGGFNLSAAETVCDDDALEMADVADILGRLVEKSMVARDASDSDEDRYRLLETVRAYALERLEEAGEHAAVAERHARWALALAEEGGDSPLLDRDCANLRAALDTLLNQEPEHAMRFCVAVVPFWLRRIDLEEATRRFDQALSSAPAPTRLRARALMAAASIDFRSGTIAQGIARVEDGHAIASAIGDIESQWRSLQLRAAFDLAGDAADAAIPRLERALALARREALGAAEANSVHSLGIAYWMLGDLDRAEELVADSVDLFDALADSCARISSPIAYAETLRGRDRRGLRIVFEDTLQPFAEISCEAATGYALANWAGIARARGDLRRARGLIDESEMCFTQAGDQAGRAAALVRRGHLELAGGELEAGRAALIEAYEIRRARGDRRGFGLVLAGLGLIDTMVGDYKTAHQELADAATIFERAGDRWGIAITLWRTAELEHAQGDLDAAEAALRRARRVLEPTQRRRWIANTLAGLAEIALERGRPQQAVALLHDARERYAAGHDQLGVQDVEGRLRAVAKDVQSVGKEPLLTTLRSFQYQRRRR